MNSDIEQIVIDVKARAKHLMEVEINKSTIEWTIDEWDIKDALMNAEKLLEKNYNLNDFKKWLNLNNYNRGYKILAIAIYLDLHRKKKNYG